MLTTELPAMTLPQLVLSHAAAHPHAVALRQKRGDTWVDISWQTYAQRAKHCAAGLLTMGIQPPHHVAVFADNRVEWVIAQIATGLINGVTLGCYPTSSAADLRHALGYGDVQVLFCENAAFLDKIRDIRQDLPKLQHLITMESANPSDSVNAMTMEMLERMGAAALQRNPELLESYQSRQTLDDVGLMVYTSGSTGAPKAAMLTYRNMRASAQGIGALLGFSPNAVILSYLPLCHIAEQSMTNFAPLAFRATVAFGGGLPTLVEDLRAIQPTYFSGVPRVWLRLQAEIVKAFTAHGQAEALDSARAAGTSRALKPRVQWTDDEKRSLQRDSAIVAKAKSIVGMARIGAATSGGAALPMDTLTFFRALDFPLLELFGQTESCGTMTLQRPDKVVPGTVGVPIPTVEMKLDADNEVLVRGENVFLGYYKNPEATAATIVDGWLHTGDIGELNDGQLRIVDRKKDIMITDGGKNIAPAEIEALMRTSDLIQECVLVAEGRKYVAALIQIQPTAFPAYTTSFTYEEIAAAPESAMLVAQEIRRLNTTLARVAQVKRAFVLQAPLRHDLGDLTPTLKVRRFMIHQRHRAEIDALYAQEIGFDIYPSANPDNPATAPIHR